MISKTGLVWFIVILTTLLWTGHTEGAQWIEYATDSEGTHYYDKKAVTQVSSSIVGVMTALLYSEEGKKVYLGRRFSSAMSNAGFDKLHYRAVRYELNCFGAIREFSISEVWELTRDAKVLDHAGTAGSAGSGSRKDWRPIDEESHLEGLYKIVCRARK